MHEMQQEVKHELEKLRHVRKEIFDQNQQLMQMKDDGSLFINNDIVQGQILGMIDEKAKQTRSSIENVLKQKIEDVNNQSKDRIDAAVHDIVVMLADKYKEMKKKRKSNIAPSPLQQSSTSTSPVTTTNTSTTNNSNEQNHLSSSRLGLADLSSSSSDVAIEAAKQRKNKLKDLYKELAKLEMEIIKDNNN